MRFENTEIYGWERAMHGMRNPLESWDKNDTVEENGKVTIGPNDLKLAQKLIRSGSEHRKFMRQIFVSVDITAPLYWWKEFDTYKVGTVANSTSTMHKLASTPITIDCFETDDFISNLKVHRVYNIQNDFLSENIIMYINMLENMRILYLETKDVRYWKELIRWLPESWLQTRTITMSYENLLSMCSKGQRRFHKLTEWSKAFIDWARTLPYAQELIFIDELEPVISNSDNKLDTMIEIMDFSVRTYNIIKRNGINTLGDLAKKTEYDFMRFRNLGLRSLQEIKDKCKKYGVIIAKE